MCVVTHHGISEQCSVSAAAGRSGSAAGACSPMHFSRVSLRSCIASFMEKLVQDETITYGSHSTNCQLFIHIVDQDYLTTRSTMGTDQQRSMTSVNCQAFSTKASFVLYVFGNANCADAA